MPLPAAILAFVAREGIKRAAQKYGSYAALIARKMLGKEYKKIRNKISKTKKLQGEKKKELADDLRKIKETRDAYDKSSRETDRYDKLWQLLKDALNYRQSLTRGKKHVKESERLDKTLSDAERKKRNLKNMTSQGKFIRKLHFFRTREKLIKKLEGSEREDKEEKQRQDYKRSIDKKFKDSLPKGNPRAWEKKKKPPGDELDRLERKEFVQGNLDRIKRQKKSVKKFHSEAHEEADVRSAPHNYSQRFVDRDWNTEGEGLTTKDALRGGSTAPYLMNAPVAATVVAGGVAAALLKKKKKQQQVEEPPLAKDFPEWGE